MRKIILATTLASLALPITPAIAWTHSAWTVRTTMMRAGPNYDYPAVQRIGRNAPVGIYGCLNDWSWCDVGYRYDRGWVAGRDLVADYRGRRQGISSYLGIGILSFIFSNYWDSHYRGRTFYNERSRWERHYYDNYQSNWGPRTNIPQIYQDRNRVSAPPAQIQRRVTVAPQAQPAPGRNRTGRELNQNRGTQTSGPRRFAPPVNEIRTQVNAPTVQTQSRGGAAPQARSMPDRSRNIPGAAQNRGNPTSSQQRTAAPPAPARQHGNPDNKGNKKDKQGDQTKPN